jgi:thioredoxin-related protein
MNKIVLLLLLPLLLHAVEWRSWQQGKTEAAAKQKSILVALVRDDCHYCHDMEREVFDDANMTHWMESCFVPVKVNLTVQKAPVEVRIPMTPTFVIVRPDATVIKTIPGSWNIPDFMALVAPACTKE